MQNKEISKNTIVYEIVQKIITMIQSKTLQLGEKLPGERVMSKTLNVSRTSLRSAYDHLEYNRILKVVPGSGTYVSEEAEFLLSQTRDSTLQNIMNLYDIDSFPQRMECRILLEPYAAQLAALYRTDSDIKELRNIINRMEEYVDSSSGSYYIEDTEFHNTIARLSGNIYLEDMIKNYCVNVHYHLLSFGSIPNLAEETFKHHKLILEAIENSDGELAKTTMLNHVIYSYEQNSKYVYSNKKVRKEFLNL